MMAGLSLGSHGAAFGFGLMELSWTGDDGQAIKLENLKGHPVLITMAYSTCRKTCTVTLRQLEEFQLEADAQRKDVEIVVVSYDPKNDTPETWANYRKQRRLNRNNWHFLTGKEADTRRLAQWLGLGDYWSLGTHVLHDFKISLLDTNGTMIKQIGWQELHVKDIFRNVE